jgi:hypothetical protein
MRLNHTYPAYVVKDRIRLLQNRYRMRTGKAFTGRTFPVPTSTFFRSFRSQIFIFLFCRSWIALISLLRDRGLIVFFPLLKVLIAHSASLALRERCLVEKVFCFRSDLFQLFRITSKSICL